MRSIQQLIAMDEIGLIWHEPIMTAGIRLTRVPRLADHVFPPKRQSPLGYSSFPSPLEFNPPLLTGF